MAMRLMHFSDASVEEQILHRSLGVAIRGCSECLATADIPQSLFRISWNVWFDKLRRLLEEPIQILVASRLLAKGNIRCCPVERNRKFKLYQYHCTWSKSSLPASSEQLVQEAHRVE